MFIQCNTKNIINKMFKEPIFDCLTKYYKDYLKKKFYYVNAIKSVYNNEYPEITKRIRLELAHDEALYYKTLTEIETIINQYQIIINQLDLQCNTTHHSNN